MSALINGEARQVLSEAGAGLFVEPENPDAMVEGILDGIEWSKGSFGALFEASTGQAIG